MQKPRFKLPRLCLSTILIEIGIICALVAVNTRPLSYDTIDVSSPTFFTPLITSGPGGAQQYIFSGDVDLDGDTDHLASNVRVANYGWPLKSIETISETNEVYHVRRRNLAANIAICFTIIICSAIAIEWSVRYAKRKQKTCVIVD